jgi:paraquat-inducible protein A
MASEGAVRVRTRGGTSSRALGVVRRSWRRWLAIVLLYASLALFVLGILMPMMSVRKGVWIFHSTQTYSIITTALALIENQDYVLTAVVVGFSIAFPLWKYWACARFLHGRLRTETAMRLLHTIRLIGKWSMLDVFVIAMLIVIIKVNGLVEARSLAGLYCFVASVLSSMVLTTVLDRAVLRQGRMG